MICTANKCVTNIIAFFINWQLFLFVFVCSDKGFYNTEKGSNDISACFGCEAGRYSAAIGLKNPNDCVECPPGTWVNSDKVGATGITSVECTFTITSQDITADAGAVVTQTISETEANTGTLRTALSGATTNIVVDFEKPCSNNIDVVIGGDTVAHASIMDTKVGSILKSCLNCNKGRYSTVSGASGVFDVCLICKAGAYQDEKGQTACKSW